MDSEIIGALIASMAVIISAIIGGWFAIKVKDIELKAKENKTGLLTSTTERKSSQWLWGIGGAVIGVVLVLIILVFTNSFSVFSSPKPIASVNEADTPSSTLAPLVTRKLSETNNVPIDTPTPIATNTYTPTPKSPTPINTPKPTNALPPAPTPTATIDADPTVYDNFDNLTFRGSFNTGRWEKEMPWGNGCSIRQQDGTIVFSSSGSSNGHLCILKANSVAVGMVKAMEADIYAEPSATGGYTIGNIQFGSLLNANEYWFAQCGIFQDENEGWFKASMNVDTSNSESGALYYDYSGIIQQGQWYKFRLEFHPNTMEVNCYLDDTLFASHVPKQANILKNSEIEQILVGHWGENTQATYYFDNVRIFSNIP